MVLPPIDLLEIGLRRIVTKSLAADNSRIPEPAVKREETTARLDRMGARSIVAKHLCIRREARYD
jgi:hypothetical protein